VYCLFCSKAHQDLVLFLEEKKREKGTQLDAISELFACEWNGCFVCWTAFDVLMRLWVNILWQKYFQNHVTSLCAYM
jgi:hypothetical protein